MGATLASSFSYQLASSSVAWVRKKATQFFNSLGKFSVIKANYHCKDTWDIFFQHQSIMQVFVIQTILVTGKMDLDTGIETGTL